MKRIESSETKGSSNRLTYAGKNIPALNIRRCALDEMPIVAKLISSSADWYREFVHEKDMNEHEVGEAWIQKNFWKRKFFLGRNQEGQAVGFHSHQTFGDVAYLGYIYLDVDQVGKGYGKRLIDHAKKVSEDMNLDAMVLLAHPEAKWATKAYMKYGFKKIAEERENVLSWNKGALKDYYEEGFHLYQYEL